MVFRNTVTVIALFACLFAVGWVMSNLRPHRHFEHHGLNTIQSPVPENRG